jgi:VWFA-related protein
VSISRYAVRVVLAFLLSLAVLVTQPIAKSQDIDKKTIKTKVRVVLLDVVVTDAKSHPVSGLYKEDFSVFEDGKSQQIVSFEPHTAALERANQIASGLPALPTNVFLNAPGPRDSLPLDILLYDLLNTPIDNQPFTHGEIVKFLKRKPPGARFAIFVLSDRLHLLQGFTEDEDQLLSAINRQEAQSYSSTDYQSQQQVHDTSSQISGTLLHSSGPGAAAIDGSTQAMVARLVHMEDSVRNYLLTRRVERTLGAFGEIAHFVAGLPGRKNLIWLSGAFPATILATSDPIEPLGSAVDYNAELRQAADLLTISEIAVYPVDIRGLQTNPIFSAADSTIYPTSQAFLQAYGGFGMELAAEHDTMDKIAEDSGGRAFYNTNGLEQAIASSIEDGTNYYTLSYSPANPKFDGRLRKIRIALDQKGYHLAYRRSYLADDQNQFAEKKANASSYHLDAALRHGAPPAHELAFVVHVVPQGEPKPITPEQITQFTEAVPSVPARQWTSAQIQRYFIDYTVLGKQLTYGRSADGTRHALLEFNCVAYDLEGNMITGQRSPVHELLSAEKAAQIRSSYYQGRQVFEVPASTTSLRVAVRNIADNRIGAMEIALPLTREPQSEAITPVSDAGAPRSDPSASVPSTPRP